jgi:hypothetical protein
LNHALDARLKHDHLAMAAGATHELPVLDLRRATRLLLLMATSPMYRPAAARWPSRCATETRELTPAMLADIAENLAALGTGDFDARERLLAAVADRPTGAEIPASREPEK